ncbi:c-type cytochrome [Chitinophagaceae bacterium LWZ2-11]
MKKLAIILLMASPALYLFAQTKPGQTKPAQAKAAPANELAASMQRGKVVYDKVCLSCHMVDGGGVPKLNPPLIQTSYVLGDKTKLILIILKGMSDRVPIEDEYYSNTMASHADLKDQQIADVLTYVRNSFGNKASAVTAAEVKAVRK